MSNHEIMNIQTIVYLFNKTIPTHFGDKTPYEIWHGVKLAISHYKVFGCFVYVFINKKMRSKLDVKITKLVFVGYINTNKGYRLWEPNTKKVKKIANVIFGETITYNNFTPILAHFTKLFTSGSKASSDIHGSNTTSYSRSNGNKPPRIGPKQLPIIRASQLHTVGTATQLHVL
jgi:hypothetical protein